MGSSGIDGMLEQDKRKAALRVPHVELNALLAEWWNLTEGVRPKDALALFRHAGFVTDDKARVCPDGTLTIYRGVPLRAASPRRQLVTGRRTRAVLLEAERWRTGVCGRSRLGGRARVLHNAERGRGDRRPRNASEGEKRMRLGSR